MNLKVQLLRDGYTAMKHLTSTGKQVFVHQSKNKFGVMTHFAIFDTPNSFRIVTRETGKNKTGWLMPKSGGLSVSTEFYPRAVSVTKTGAGLPYQSTSVILSEDGKNIDTVRRKWGGKTSGTVVLDFAHNQKIRYFPETDKYTQLYIDSKPWTSIRNALEIL